MTTIHHLPLDILTIIIDQVGFLSNQLTCRLVCFKWYLLVTKAAFKEIHINNNVRFNQFLEFTTNRHLNRLMPLGEMVSTIIIKHIEGFDRRTPFITRHEFEQLVRRCPNVETISASRLTFLSFVSAYLLDIDDSIKWSIKSFLTERRCYQFTIDHYYKYKDSIVCLEDPVRMNSIQFLESFPSLQQLYLHKYRVASMEEFMFIFDTCLDLQLAAISLHIDRIPNTFIRPKPYPSLKELAITSYSHPIHEGTIDYITQKFIGLCKIRIQVDSSPEHDAYNVAYSRLLETHLMRAGQSYEFQLTFIHNDGWTDTGNSSIRIDTTRACLSSIFGTRQTSSNIYHYLIVRVLDDRAKRLKLETCLEKVKIDLSRCRTEISLPHAGIGSQLNKYLDDTASNIYELHVNGLSNPKEKPLQGLHTAIEKCSRLEKLTLLACKLQSFKGCLSLSVQTVHINHVETCPTFFKDLVVSFPNLKYLCIGHTTIVNDCLPVKPVVIDLLNLNLESLSLYNLKQQHCDFDRKPCMILVTTSGKTTYFKKCLFDNPEKLTRDDAIEEEIRADPMHQLHIRCRKIHQLWLYGIKFEIN
ncbi:hypothetical protein RMCBS344292_13780 [Rhizopus microsporus]|nr:hypothetical protein RMCBS344292_13780 [Rhizopus microsporus]